MSPVSINGIDKQGVDVNGVQVKQSLSAASETVNKGVYAATTLSTVDPDLAIANIRDAITIFGKLGTLVAGVDVSDADAAVGDVKDPKTFYSVAAPRKTGTMPTVAIVAANDDYPAGYHAGNVGGLDAIDADLAVGNIKSGVTIFGKLGTVVPGGVVTADMATGSLNGSSYTPATVGMFDFQTTAGIGFFVEFYSTANTTWYPLPVDMPPEGAQYAMLVPVDGANVRFRNQYGPNDYSAMRLYLSTGTYERLRDSSLAAKASYTPADHGYFAVGGEDGDDIMVRINAGAWTTNLSWNRIEPSRMYSPIGDGTNLQVYNNDAATTFDYVLLRGSPD